MSRRERKETAGIKRYKSLLFLAMLGMMLGTGCEKSPTEVRDISSENTVEKIIQEQMKTDNGETVSEKKTEENTQVFTKDDSPEKPYAGSVDYDLTKMDSDMVYATVFQMMSAPQQYEGKTFRMDGLYYSIYYETTDKYYHYCIIQDALACCAQGMEFVWGDGSHQYPEEYPAEEAEIIVEGIFETYREDGDDNLYCRLANASLEVCDN